MDESENQKKPVEIFISYSRKDQEYKDKLLSSLSDLEEDGTIFLWHDRRIVAGDEWGTVIDEHINHASIILLLISPDYLDSDPCQYEERRAKKRQKEGTQK
jgi:hypothetical protein